MPPNMGNLCLQHVVAWAAGFLGLLGQGGRAKGRYVYSARHLQRACAIIWTLFREVVVSEGATTPC